MKNGISRAKKNEKEMAALSIIFPGSERWELWQGATWQSLAPVASAEKPGGLPPPAGAIFCFPGSVFSSLPLWNPVAEGVSPREQAGLNLEGRGLLGADPEAAVWALDSIRRQSFGPGEGERELSASAILQTQIPPDLILEEIRRHEIPGRLLPAPGSGPGVVLRKELGRWVLDLYDHGQWLHSQTLLARELGEEAAREIRLLLVQLEQEGVFHGCRELVAAIPVSRDVAETMARLMGLRWVQREKAQEFVMPSSPWDLLPNEVAQGRQTKLQQKRVRHAVTFFLAGDLALWAVAALFVLVPAIRLWHLEHALAPVRPEYQRLLQTKQTWEELRSLTDPTGSALEVLNQVAQPLLGDKPKMAVKFTAFSFGPAELVVQGVTGLGEQVIADYLLSLSSNPALQGLYVWPSTAFVEGQGQSSVFTITAPSTAPQPEKKEGTNPR